MAVGERAARTEGVLALGTRIWDLLRQIGFVNEVRVALGAIVLAGRAWAMTLLNTMPVWAWLLTYSSRRASSISGTP